LKSARDALAKRESAYARDPKSVSRDALDGAANAAAGAKANLEVAQRQYEVIGAEGCARRRFGSIGPLTIRRWPTTGRRC